MNELADRVAARMVDRLPTNGMRPQRLLTVEQAATYLGRTKTAIQHMVSDGVLPVVRHDRRVFLDICDLDRWIADAKGHH